MSLVRVSLGTQGRDIPDRVILEVLAEDLVSTSLEAVDPAKLSHLAEHIARRTLMRR